VTVVTAIKETTPLGAIIKLGKDGRVVDSTGRVARPVSFLRQVRPLADIAEGYNYHSDRPVHAITS
jgi:hypothetical protein